MLSVVITTWNEEKNLPRAVRSVSDIADEIVVVDTESTDNTVSVAKELGCKVFHHKNTSIVEPVRNFSISKAKGDWILLLDADEEVTPTLSVTLTTIMQKDTADYVRIPRQNMIFGRHIKTSHWWPDYVYRFFKKGHITWQDEIHSIPITTGNGIDLSPTAHSCLIHHHYETISQFVMRLDRYTDIQAQELLSTHYKFVWSDLITKPLSEFFTQYFSRAGYSEGLHGLALSILQSFSSFILYLKLWQHSGFIQISLKPSDIRHVLKPSKSEFQWWYYQTKIDSSPQILKPFWKLIRKIDALATRI